VIDLYYWPTLNAWKVSIMLEECGLPYAVKPVNIGRGEQFRPEYVAVNPNSKVPAIVDHEPIGGGPAMKLFESGAILFYLAEKTGRFIPADARGRYAVTQWLMWQMGGLGPMAGQNGHFLLYAKDAVPYAIERYGRETRRLYTVLDTQLARTGAFVAGEYSIADMACFTWIMPHKRQKLSLDDFPALKRWYAEIRARPAVQRGLAIGKEQFRAIPDEAARAHLFGEQAT
jgi:GST-like protein